MDKAAEKVEAEKGPAVNDFGVPVGVSLSHGEVMRMQRALAAAHGPEEVDEPVLVPKTRKGAPDKATRKLS